MNRISPLNESDLDSRLATSIQPDNIVMNNKRNSSTNFIDNNTNVESDLNPLPSELVLVIKEESTSDNQNKTNDTSNQISALVKFIKNSFSSNKKKSDPVLSPKLICLQKLPNNPQSNNQIDISNSEQSNCNINLSITSSNDIFCRFCQEFEPENELVSPCLCSGTLKYIHQSCLQRWIKVQDNRFCELCKYGFRMKVTSKPLREWKKLEMTVMERRKIICSVTFHIIALTCVIWSLYVLIERTTEEIHNGIMEWPLWTKLIVVAIGFIGGVVFMYVQCRMYVSLCRKWHIYNRTFIVQNISPTELLAAQKEAKIKSDNYQKNVHLDRIPMFGDASVQSAQNTNLAPIVSSSDEDFNLTSPSGTEIQNYHSKMFSDEEDSYVRDVVQHTDMNEITHSTNTLAAHRTVNS